MNRLDTQRVLILLVHALVGWALCTAIIAVGFALTTVQTTLVLHAIGGPILFGLVTWSYVRRFGHATPLQIAVSFVATALIVDLVVVALLVLRSLEMFGSVLGTWLPYASIFVVSYLVARFTPRARRARPSS